MKEAAELIARLRKRAKEDQACADNSAVIVEALSGQMKLFDDRAGHNVYAVRMAVDHRNSVRRDTQYAADLTEAADHIETLEARVATLSAEAKHYPTVAGENMRLREALDAARTSIVSGCDTIHAIAAIDRALAAREASR